jgi:uncharacterized protein YjaZ
MRSSFNFIIIFFLSIPFVAWAQTHEQLNKKGDSAYLAKNYTLAISYYKQLTNVSKAAFANGGMYYNIACCYALKNDSTNAWLFLDTAMQNGYRNYAHILADSDLEPLHHTKKWLLIFKLNYEAQEKLKDPEKAELVTADIHNFWTAYDLVQKDTTKMIALYDSLYFGKASTGLRDYYNVRIFSTQAFVANQKEKPKFYNAIRNNTLLVDQFKPQIKKSFIKLKNIYPQALFPNVYFVIGKWNSAGTVSSNGLLIGTDMMSKSDAIPLDELTLWEKNNYKSIDGLPYIVAHELIHYEQDNMKNDTTTLSDCIREGMADFIGELISGKSSNPRLLVFAKGKEQKIWADFEKDMYLNRSENWIANSNQETPDHPADLGYWIGYQICKSYYEEATNKNQAVFDMLHIKDYRDFLQKSKFVEKVKAMPQ